jgi:hypothetical protein
MTATGEAAKQHMLSCRGKSIQRTPQRRLTAKDLLDKTGTDITMAMAIPH